MKLVAMSTMRATTLRITCLNLSSLITSGDLQMSKDSNEGMTLTLSVPYDGVIYQHGLDGFFPEFTLYSEI